MSDLGFTHIALTARDPGASAAFYARYAEMTVVHDRTDASTGHRVVWLSDGTRPFVIVLIQSAEVTPKLDGMAHLGVAVASREEVDRRCDLARSDGRAVRGPFDYGPPVGYWAFIPDPDGHNLEISTDQEIELAVETVAHPEGPRG